VLRINQVAVHVTYRDEASPWYTEKLGFVRRQDETYADGARWLTVSSPDQTELTLVLDKRPQFPADSGIGKSPVFNDLNRRLRGQLQNAISTGRSLQQSTGVGTVGRRRAIY
jgi:hypothetical protein